MKTSVEVMPRRWDQASAAAGWLEGRHDGMQEQRNRVIKAFDDLEASHQLQLEQMVDEQSRQQQLMIIDWVRNVRFAVDQMSCL